MKAFKITLVVAVISIIAFFLIRSIIIPPSPPTTKGLAGSPYIKMVDDRIDSLKQKPDSKFCKNYYDLINFYIQDYHRNGKFSSVSSQNNQLREDLSKQLYAAYTNKFIQQAYYVFRREDWRSEDLSFIRKEAERLKRSPYLERNSPVFASLTELQTILNKHDEIAGFIAFCKGFSYTGTGLSDRFPEGQVKAHIAKANAYLSNNMGNQYVNNCTRLRQGLKEASKQLFNAHVRYFDNKITYWSGSYGAYLSQKAYMTSLYLPFKEEIEDFENETYSANSFDAERRRLLIRWQGEATKAYEYFN